MTAACTKAGPCPSSTIRCWPSWLATARTVEQAIHRLLRALYEYFVGGIKTNVSLFRRILKDPDFRAGNLDTGFLDRLLTKPSNETDARSSHHGGCGRSDLRHHGSQDDLAGREWRGSMNGNAAAAPTAFKLAPHRPRRSAAER